MSENFEVQFEKDHGFGMIRVSILWNGKWRHGGTWDRNNGIYMDAEDNFFVATKEEDIRIHAERYHFSRWRYLDEQRALLERHREWLRTAE